MRFFEFLKRQFQIAHVSGIPVRADLRWVFVLVVLSWITAASINSETGNSTASLFFGVLTTVIFFASIFIHELAHAFVAKMEGIQVMEIVLHPFGGLARFRREPDTPRAEFRIAIAGPAASFLLAIVFFGLMAAANSLGEKNILSPLCFLLFLLNFLIAVFNMFPGYPLDGGRVLRAYLWSRGTDFNDATVLTGKFGKVIGGVLVVFGIYVSLVQGHLFMGFWTILVGVFLYDSAKGIIKNVQEIDKLIVEDVMSLAVSVLPEMTILQFVDQILPRHRQTIFPVAKDRQLYGMLTLSDLKEIPRDEWKANKILEVMRPITSEYFIESDQLYRDAKEMMRHNEIGALGVIDRAGNLVGFLQTKRKG